MTINSKEKQDNDKENFNNQLFKKAKTKLPILFFLF